MLLLRLKKLVQILSDFRLISALLKGSAAGMEHLQVLRDLGCVYVVDVGANRGQFALAARRAFPQAKIHSFEPLVEAAQVFRRVFDHDPNVFLYPVAVGSARVTAAIHVTRDDDSSSILPVARMQTEMFPDAVETEIRPVDVYPLSQLIDPACIPPASLLKIDVQGFELEVLQGCADILNKFSYLYIECSFVELYEGQALAHQVVSWLKGQGFAFCGIYNVYYEKNGRAIQGDFLFEKSTGPQAGGG